jgi:ribosomal protein L11 methyltransferase
MAGASAVEERDSDDGRTCLIADPDPARTAAIEGRWTGAWVAVDDAVLDRWRDWAAPVRVGRIVVVPAWQPAPPTEPDDIVVVLDPGRAFGTGSHPSTRLALAALQRLVRPGDVVVDLGCGSGVLAIAAHLLGAAEVVAEDIDPEARRATEENAGRNGLAGALLLADRHLLGWPADLLVANIGADELIGFAPMIGAPTVVLSGILADRGDEVAAAYAAHGYREVERPQEDGWVAPVLQRRTPATAETGMAP